MKRRCNTNQDNRLTENNRDTTTPEQTTLHFHLHTACIVMASNISKVDLSLDEIIKLSKKGRGRGGGGPRGKGRGRGGAGNRQPIKTGRAQAGSGTVAKLRAGSQARAQQIRQRARQTIQQKKRVASGMKSEQEATNVKQRLGVTPAQTRGRGRGTRGRGRGTAARGRGRGQSGGQDTAGQGKIRILRGAKTVGRGGRRGRGRGKYDVSVIKNQLKQAAQSQQQTTPTRGRGGRRGRGRGRGQPNRPMQVAIQPQFEPVGVDLHPFFAADQHTSKSLNARFTPQSEKRMQQRLIIQGQRSVDYQS